jgi:hypothetical protein
MARRPVGGLDEPARSAYTARMSAPVQPTPPAPSPWAVLAPPWMVATGVVLLAGNLIVRDLGHPVVLLGDLGMTLMAVGLLWQLRTGTSWRARGGSRTGLWVQVAAFAIYVAARLYGAALRG